MSTHCQVMGIGEFWRQQHSTLDSRFSWSCTIHDDLVSPSACQMGIQKHHQNRDKLLQGEGRYRRLVLLVARWVGRGRLEVRQERPCQRMQVHNCDKQTGRRGRWPGPCLRDQRHADRQCRAVDTSGSSPRVQSGGDCISEYTWKFSSQNQNFW